MQRGVLAKSRFLRYLRRFLSQGVTFCRILSHFYVVSASLGGRMYAFLRGIRKSGWQNVCIFMWYLQVWVGECMHIYGA